MPEGQEALGLASLLPSLASSLRTLCLDAPSRDITPLAQLTQLKELDHNNRGVVIGLDEVLRACKGLTTLRLRVLEVPPGVQLHSAALEQLSIYNARLSSLPASNDMRFPALKEVVVYGMSFCKRGVTAGVAATAAN